MTHEPPTPLAITRALNTLLERPYWLQHLQLGHAYTRRHDDTDGDRSARQDVTVVFGPDGDAWVHVGLDALRFRTWAGGGQSLRVRAALMVLAEAIRRDNEEIPQAPRELAA